LRSPSCWLDRHGDLPPPPDSAWLCRAKSGAGQQAVEHLAADAVAIPHLAIAVLLVNVIGQSGFVARLAHFAGLAQVPADLPRAGSTIDMAPAS